MTTAADPATPPLAFFLPLTKVDVEQRLVYGVATDETPDRSGEICDYASSKPYFERWSGEITKATGGKSHGNVRAMHGKTAAGKLTSINFNDQFRAIEVCAKIIDDDEWLKVIEGVYTGFSQGGRYVKRWADPDAPGLTRYTAEPMEISLVDLPCLPSATFKIIKAAGAVEERHFRTPPDEKKVDLAAKVVDISKVDGDEREALAKAADELAAEEDPVDPFDDGDDEPVVSKTDAIEPERVEFFKCECADHQHKKRRAAIKCVTATRAAEEAAKAAAPVKGALDALAGLLGAGTIAEAASAPLWLAAEDMESVAKIAADEVTKRIFSAEARRKLAMSGAAMKNGSFPIETKADLENAIHAVGRAKDPAAAKTHIMERAKALGCVDCIPADWMSEGAKKAAARADLAKYMGEEAWDASEAISVLQSLYSILSCEASDTENDASQAADLRAAIERVKAFIASEVQENHDDSDPAKALDDMEMAVGRLSDLAKRGARNSGADQARLQKCHDLMKELGADCGGMNGKAAGASAEMLEKASAENAALRGELGKIVPALEAIKAEVAKFRVAPAPARAAANALGFLAANGGASAFASPEQAALELLGKMTGDQRADFLMKAALRAPIDLSKPPGH